MILENIKDVFFDLDHTLWDFDKNSEMAFGSIFQKRHPRIELQAFIASYALFNQAFWTRYQYDQITLEELRYGRLKQTFDALQYEISDEEIDSISEAYIEFLPNYNHLFEGAIEILDYLKKNYRLHIITNGFASVQTRKINNAHLAPYFETITNSEMAGVKKPNPKIFEYALRQAQAKKEQSVMIGDSLEADVQGALNYGMQALFFNEANTPVENPIIQINHLLEIKKYL